MKKNILHGHVMAAMVGRMLGKYEGSNAINRKLGAAAEAVLNLEKLAATSNPMETDAAHARRVAAAAKKLADKISRLESELADEATHQRDRVQREIEIKARLTPTKHAEEIRTTLRSMNEKDRMASIIEALRDPETGAEILAAIADGNLITSGLRSDVRARFVNDFQKMQAPELFKEMAAIDEVLQHTPKVFEIAKQASNDAFDPDYIERINEAEKSALEASESFNQSVA